MGQPAEKNKYNFISPSLHVCITCTVWILNTMECLQIYPTLLPPSEVSKISLAFELISPDPFLQAFISKLMSNLPYILNA